MPMDYVGILTFCCNVCSVLPNPFYTVGAREIPRPLLTLLPLLDPEGHPHNPLTLTPNGASLRQWPSKRAASSWSRPHPLKQWWAMLCPMRRWRGNQRQLWENCPPTATIRCVRHSARRVCMLVSVSSCDAGSEWVIICSAPVLFSSTKHSPAVPPALFTVGSSVVCEWAALPWEAAPVCLHCAQPHHGEDVQGPADGRCAP